MWIATVLLLCVLHVIPTFNTQFRPPYVHAMGGFAYYETQVGHRHRTAVNAQRMLLAVVSCASRRRSVSCGIVPKSEVCCPTAPASPANACACVLSRKPKSAVVVAGRAIIVLIIAPLNTTNPNAAAVEQGRIHHLFENNFLEAKLVAFPPLQIPICWL